jgi:hypothetical protein
MSIEDKRQVTVRLDGAPIAAVAAEARSRLSKGDLCRFANCHKATTHTQRELRFADDHD